MRKTWGAASQTRNPSLDMTRFAWRSGGWSSIPNLVIISKFLKLNYMLVVMHVRVMALYIYIYIYIILTWNELDIEKVD